MVTQLFVGVRVVSVASMFNVGAYGSHRVLVKWAGGKHSFNVGMRIPTKRDELGLHDCFACASCGEFGDWQVRCVVQSKVDPGYSVSRAVCEHCSGLTTSARDQQIANRSETVARVLGRPTMDVLPTMVKKCATCRHWKVRSGQSRGECGKAQCGGVVAVTTEPTAGMTCTEYEACEVNCAGCGHWIRYASGPTSHGECLQRGGCATLATAFCIHWGRGYG